MTNTYYTLDEVRFDCDNRLLAWQGRQVIIDPRLVDLLVCLARDENQVINRDDILRQVWENQVVNDHALTQTVSELRKALAKLNPDFKYMIKTVPKCGYKLIANVTVSQHEQTDAVSAAVEDDISRPTQNRFVPEINSARQVRYLVLLAVLFLLACGSYLYGTSQAEMHRQPLLNADRIAFRVFTSSPADEHIAFGVSDLINYRINSLSHYSASLVYSHDSQIIDQSGLVISGEVQTQGQQRKLHLKVYDNIVNTYIFQQVYDLSGDALLTTPAIILSDIGNLLEESFDQTIIVRTERQYPAQLAQLNWIYEAHHAGNQVTSQSLHHAVMLFQRVLDNEPDMAIAVAEQGIVMRLLVDIEPGSIDPQAYERNFQHLLQLEHQSQFLPPVYYESRALHEFDPANLVPAENNLHQAIQVRDSWLSSVIEGKIAESKGLDFRSKRAYTNAYARKPCQATLNAIQHLLFPTDLQKFMPNMQDKMSTEL